MKYIVSLLAAVVATLLVPVASNADTVTLRDGTTINNCFVRDEGTKLQVWEKMADVGTPNWKVIPHALAKDTKLERDDAWDAHPDLPDLSVTFIDMTPYLQSLHGKVDYDQWGRPVPKGKGTASIRPRQRESRPVSG